MSISPLRSWRGSWRSAIRPSFLISTVSSSRDPNTWIGIPNSLLPMNPSLIIVLLRYTSWVGHEGHTIDDGIDPCTSSFLEYQLRSQVVKFRLVHIIGEVFIQDPVIVLLLQVASTRVLHMFGSNILFWLIWRWSWESSRRSVAPKLYYQDWSCHSDWRSLSKCVHCHQYTPGPLGRSELPPLDRSCAWLIWYENVL